MWFRYGASGPPRTRGLPFQVSDLRPGRACDLGCGEGRNAADGREVNAIDCLVRAKKSVAAA